MGHKFGILPSKKTNKVENVQKLFTKLLYYRAMPDANYPLALPPYTVRLREFNLKTLFYRRVVADLVFAFKILRAEVSLRPSKFWIFRPANARRASFRLTTHVCRVRRRVTLQQSFAQRACVLLNKLPPSLMRVSSSASLKRQLSQLDVLAVLKLKDVS